MAYPETTFDVLTPDGSDNPTAGDDEIRLVKASLQERLNLEHVFDKSGSEVSGANTGKHSNITTLSITNAGALTNAGLATLQSLKLATGATIVEVSIDGTLADDADTVVPTEKAVKTYVDAQIAALPSSPSYSKDQTQTVTNAEPTGAVNFPAIAIDKVLSVLCDICLTANIGTASEEWSNVNRNYRRSGTDGGLKFGSAWAKKNGDGIDCYSNVFNIGEVVGAKTVRYTVLYEI